MEIHPSQQPRRLTVQRFEPELFTAVDQQPVNEGIFRQSITHRPHVQANTVAKHRFCKPFDVTPLDWFVAFQKCQGPGRRHEGESTARTGTVHNRCIDKIRSLVTVLPT
jgi:hypothetical protein